MKISGSAASTERNRAMQVAQNATASCMLTRQIIGGILFSAANIRRRYFDNGTMLIELTTEFGIAQPDEMNNWCF